MIKTSLYNHNELGTKERPLIKNIQFKRLCERIKKGETGLKEKALQHFTLVEAQITLLDQLIRKEI